MPENKRIVIPGTIIVITQTQTNLKNIGIVINDQLIFWVRGDKLLTGGKYLLKSVSQMVFGFRSVESRKKHKIKLSLIIPK